MNILVVTQHARSGSGPGRNIVASLSALLRHSSATITLVSETMGDDIEGTESPRFRWESDFHPKTVSKWPSSLATIRRAAKGADVIWVPANLGSLFLAQSVRSGRPLLCGPNVSHLPHRCRDAPGRVETELLCDAWVEASQARRTHVGRHVNPERLMQIPHALSTDQFSPGFRDRDFWHQHGLTGPGPVALFVGKDYELKGLTQLLGALELVNRRREVPVQFAAVGRIGPENQARIDALPWAVAPGFLSGAELSAAFASADFSVAPSSWENFPFALLEAQSSGIPSVCGSRGGMPEVVADGETGIVVEIASNRDGLHLPEAPDRLAEAIVRLADDSTLRSKLGDASRQRVLREFSLPRLAENMMAAFHQLKGTSVSK
jgi:glycosyltransferase involved in cell wall biosynthesis